MELLQTVLTLFASPVQQHVSSAPAQDVLDRIVAAQPRRRLALAEAALHEEQQLRDAHAPHPTPTDPGPPAPSSPLVNHHADQPCPAPKRRHQPRSSTDTAEAGSNDAAGSDNALRGQAPTLTTHAAQDDSHLLHHDSNHPSSNTTQATGSHNSSKVQAGQAGVCNTHHQIPQHTPHPDAPTPASPNADTQLHRTASYQPAAHSQAASPSPPSPSPSPAVRSTPKKAPTAAAAATATARARPAAKPKRKPKNAEEFLRQQMSGIRRQKAQASNSKATAGTSRGGRKPGGAAEAQQQQQQQQQQQPGTNGPPQPLQQLNSPPSVSMEEASKQGTGQHAHADGREGQRAAGQGEKRKRDLEDADAHAGSEAKKRGRCSKRQREQTGLEVHTGLTTSSSSSSSGGRDDGIEEGGGGGAGVDSAVAEDTTVPAQLAGGSGSSAPQSRGAQATQQKGNQQQQQAALAKQQRLQQQQQRRRQEEQRMHREQQQQQQQRRRQEEQRTHQEQQQQQGETDEEDESGGQLGDMLHLSFGQLQQQRAQLPSARMHPPPLLSEQQQQQQQQEQPPVSPAKPAPPAKPPLESHTAAAQWRTAQPAGEQAQEAAGAVKSACMVRSSAAPNHEGQGGHAKQQPPKQGVPPHPPAARGVAAAKMGAPDAPVNRVLGADSHLHVHVPIGLGIQGPTPADLKAAHQEALKLREQQAEALERERLGLNMKHSTNQPVPSTKPQLQARRAQLQQQQQQQQPSQQSHSYASTQTCLPSQQPAAPPPQQPQQQQPRLTELQKFRQQQQQSGQERFGLLHKAGFKSHQPPRKGGGRGVGPGGLQGRQPGGIQGVPGGFQGQQPGSKEGQPMIGAGRGQPLAKDTASLGGIQGLAGKGGQAAITGGAAGVVQNPQLLRTLERYHQRTHDACTDAAGLKAANLAWAEAMREGAEELDVEGPPRRPAQSLAPGLHKKGAVQEAVQGEVQKGGGPQEHPQKGGGCAAAEPVHPAPPAAAAATQLPPPPEAEVCAPLAAGGPLGPAAAAAPAAAVEASVAPNCVQSAATHGPDVAARGVEEGGMAVISDEEDEDGAGEMERAVGHCDGGESESDGAEEREEAVGGRSSRRRKPSTGSDPPRPPHKRVLSLGKGQPGHGPGPNSTVVEVGLYADIKAHGKEGKKRRKQAYQFAQEHPDLAPPPKQRRPTYEVQQQAVCRYWLFGTCRNAGCAFKHEGQPVPKRLIPCEFHARGACRNGTGCNFSHSLGSPQPCKQLILEGSCHSNGDCRFSHDFSREDLQLLFEYFSFTEGRQQRAAAARAAAVPDAPAPGLQPPPLSQACFSSQGDTYIPPLQVGGGAEVEEI